MAALGSRAWSRLPCPVSDGPSYLRVGELVLVWLVAAVATHGNARHCALS
jgi:hypothetical protein